MRFNQLSRGVLLAITILSASVAGFAQVSVGVAVHFGPPALPVYVQPLCPAPGYIWTPGYWAWDPGFGDYYWVPGTWILAPHVGFLWTPAYWGWNGLGFVFFPGYWGPQIGFYGGINYGFGYFGTGYVGGRWDHGAFYYNRAVNNVNVTNIHNVYNTTVNNVTVNRVSYNGGAGGVTARPNAAEEAAAREQHIPRVAAQTQHVETARADPQLRASVNQGKPPIAATDKPASFKGNGVVAAQEAGAPYHPPANRGATPAARQENATPATPSHAKDLQSHPQPSPPYTGNAKADEQYAQQQQKLAAQQNQEHQKLAQQQEAEHQQATQQKANQAQMQQMEQKHQQQTQQMEQRHSQQQQQMVRQAPPPPPQHSAPPPRK
jgi:WXXGXW repeat (2 copies)